MNGRVVYYAPTMRLQVLSRAELLDWVHRDAQGFLERIASPEVFIVKAFYEAAEILALRARVFASGLAQEPSWHPLLDGCPDYHRIHDNYPRAHVKSRMHGFYFHGYHAHNQPLFQRFEEIFAIKNQLGRFARSEFLDHTPSRGQVARVNLHHYPRGGGYIAEHVDPTSPFALVQTLIQASSFGSDFTEGGLFARDTPAGEMALLDQHTAPGDLIVMSPAVPHGVQEVDPGRDYDWRENSGKWTIIPIVVASDYPSQSAGRPRPL